MANKITAMVKYISKSRRDNKENYTFEDVKTKQKYIWNTTSIFGLVEGNEYKIEYIQDAINQNPIRIKNVDIYEWRANTYKTYAWRKISKC